MPTKKIKDLDFNPCKHPEHNPPSMRVFEPGLYEHECPACGHKVTFVVHAHHCWTRKVKKGERKPIVTLREELNRAKASSQGRDYDAFNEGYKSALHFALSKL